MTAFNPCAWQRDHFALTAISQGLISAKTSSVKKHEKPQQPSTRMAANSTISCRKLYWQSPKAPKHGKTHPVQKQRSFHIEMDGNTWTVRLALFECTVCFSCTLFFLMQGMFWYKHPDYRKFYSSKNTSICLDLFYKIAKPNRDQAWKQHLLSYNQNIVHASSPRSPASTPNLSNFSVRSFF